MIENRPPRLPVPGRDHGSARTPDDRERRAQARRPAEALFTPKPPTLEPIAAPPAAPREAISAPTHLEPPPAKVLPAAHLRAHPHLGEVRHDDPPGGQNLWR
jgi:hypothetical protein